MNPTMLPTLVVLALAAEPLNSQPVTLALPGLNAVNLNPGEGELYAELIAQKFIERGVKVMTARDLNTLLGMERQRQLLGCAEDNACIVEMTAALGADGMLVGDLGKLGDEYVLNLKVLSSRNAEALALHNARAPNARALQAVIDESVRAILRSLAPKLKRPELLAVLEPVPEVVKPGPAPIRTWAIAPAAVGVVGLGAGVALQLVADGKYQQLRRGGLSQPEAASLRDSGRGLETGGTVALIGGAVALGGAALMFFLGAEGPAPTAMLVPGGGAIGIAGALP